MEFRELSPTTELSRRHMQPRSAAAAIDRLAGTAPVHRLIGYTDRYTTPVIGASVVTHGRQAGACRDRPRTPAPSVLSEPAAAALSQSAPRPTVPAQSNLTETVSHLSGPESAVQRCKPG